MKTLGSIRRVNLVEAEVVLASGEYLTFRIDSGKKFLHNLIEVSRTKVHGRARESIVIDAHTLQLARRAALGAILRHRRAMLLPQPFRPINSGGQLSFSFK